MEEEEAAADWAEAGSADVAELNEEVAQTLPHASNSANGISGHELHDQGAAETGRGDGGPRWLVAKHLPNVAKGYTWFTRFGAICNVSSAAFFGLRAGHIRWAVVECPTAAEAVSLTKALNAGEGASRLSEARLIDEAERDQLIEQGRHERKGPGTFTQAHGKDYGRAVTRCHESPRRHNREQRPGRGGHDSIGHTAGRSRSRQHRSGREGPPREERIRRYFSDGAGGTSSGAPGSGQEQGHNGRARRHDRRRHRRGHRSVQRRGGGRRTQPGRSGKEQSQGCAEGRSGRRRHSRQADRRPGDRSRRREDERRTRQQGQKRCRHGYQGGHEGGRKWDGRGQNFPAGSKSVNGRDDRDREDAIFYRTLEAPEMEDLPPFDDIRAASEHPSQHGEAQMLSQADNFDGSASVYTYTPYSDSECDEQTASAQQAFAEAAAAVPSSRTVSSAMATVPQAALAGPTAAVQIANERRREAEQAWRLHRLKADRVASLASEVRQKEEALWKLRNDLAACQRDELELKQLAEQRTTEAETAEVKIKQVAEGGRAEKRVGRGYLQNAQ